MALQSPPKPATTRPRPISLRASAKSPLTASQSSTTTTTAASNNVQLPSTVSSRILFLTNLRLLDLDQEEDWPDITPSTFSTKDAVVNQKKRIQAVEWALYQLFNLWDPEETQNKLRPFYPPLDQVQSINLRAAFTRCLEQAKKNGVLGRDAVIRKTMLDECKGERFEEVLAVFSSAVLKKLVAERALNAGHDYRPSISESIAIENWGYKGDRTELNALLLAHKASLRSHIRDKDAARERYRDFAQLLARKEQTIAKRNEQLKSLAEDDPSSQPTDKMRYQVRQMLKMNWTGNEEWTENILYGENSSSKGGLLSTPFEEVWDGVQNGTLEDIEDQSMGLLDQLDQRVQVQRARLEKWDGFRKKLFGYKATEPSKTSAPDTKGIDLGFTAHLKLSAETMSAQDVDKLHLPPPPPQYAQMLESMKAELNSDLAGIPDFASLVTNRSTSIAYRPEEEEPEPVSDLDEWEKEIERETKAAKPPPATRRGSRLRSPKRRPVVRTRTLNTRPAIEESDDDEDVEDEVEPPRSERQDPTSSSRSSVTPEQEKPAEQEGNIKMMRYSPPLSPPRSQSPELVGPMPRSKKPTGVELTAPDRATSPTQLAANQILASMSNASPSPLKKPRHTLSLTERTRMSITRTPSFDPDEYDHDTQLLSPTPKPRVNIQALSHNTAEPGPEEPEDLVARTQRSMQGYEAARQKAQLERRRSERKSRMASPRKENSHLPVAEEDDVGEQSTFVEELLDKGVEDMELVFRSRPKMRTSPAPSPGRRWDQDLYEDEEEWIE